MQLNKFVASCGICSRRDAANLIKEGMISVNNQTITDPGYKVTASDIVKHHGLTLKIEEKIYVVLNKPCGYITTVSDEKGRRTVLDLVKIPHKNVRLFPIGRLDKETTGLLILTNDGELAQKLSHPRYEKIKIYQATLDKPLDNKSLQNLQNGVYLEDGFCKPNDVQYISEDHKIIKIILHSGKNRIIRRLFKHLHYTVIALDRIDYAGITKKSLAIGKWRMLSIDEIDTLLNKKP
jgi:pseudouridine synthase